ncbi:MAG: hypothetical protein K6F18_03160 [Lactobacillus sp.]|nr:hypothetical protein [Lactobacillus sp.]
MDKLNQLYTQIEQQGIQAIRTRQVQIDPNLQNLEVDSRQGLTLLVKLPAHVTRNINFVLNELKRLEPFQYYYPANTIHITVMDIRRAVSDFRMTKEELINYQQVIQKTIENVNAINWHMAGLICSPGAILVKGFYSSELQQLRNALRTNFLKNGLVLDERYATFSGHATVARFKKNLIHPQEFLSEINNFHNVEFGDFQTSEVDLVIHDWYNRRSHLIERFSLKTT